MQLKTVAIIQARMTSTRLPGKVMKKVYGRTILERMIERVKKARTLNDVIIATTIDPSDDLIENLCQKLGVKIFRGSMKDVLDRFYQAAKLYDSDNIVRLTGDCPLIDPALIDEVVQALIRNKADFACNRLPPPFSRTYPIGLDVEACTFKALTNAWENSMEKHQREHVLPYLYEVPDRFKVIQLNYSKNMGDLRWTLDTPEDLLLLRRIYRYFKGRNDFSWLDVLSLYEETPALFMVNAKVKHKNFKEFE